MLSNQIKQTKTLYKSAPFNFLKETNQANIEHPKNYRAPGNFYEIVEQTRESLTNAFELKAKGNKRNVGENIKRSDTIDVARGFYIRFRSLDLRSFYVKGSRPVRMSISRFSPLSVD